jgi:RNA-binding protein
MALASKQKQQLKALAHKLKPVVIVGNNGVTDNVNNEIERALDDHELIKMRINTDDRVMRKALFAEISAAHNAELIQTVGKIGVIYRVNKDKA